MRVLRTVVFGFLFLLAAAAAVFAQDKATQQFTLTVASPTLTISTTSVPHATVGVAYSTAVQVTGGVTPYSFSVTNGALPAGVSLNAGTGVISGTPTAAGTASFTVRVSDTETPPQVASQALTLLVINALTITTVTVPNAQIGTVYSASIGIAGGVPPYTCSVLSGTLPTGLALSTSGSSCVISGTPTQAGQFTFTIQVADSLPAGQIVVIQGVARVPAQPPKSVH